MLLRKIFENLHAAMAFLVLFEEISRKFCLNFFTLIVSASSNMMHFVRTFSIMRVKDESLLLSKRFQIMEKLYTSKTCLKMAGGRMHIAYFSPCSLYPPVAISYRNH